MGPQPSPAAPDPAGSHEVGLRALALGALGVVYGDIGTSPLYAMRECFGGEHAVAPTHANVLGVLSLVVWALVLVIVVKYLTFIMRADNRGEGGILALLALQSGARGHALDAARDLPRPLRRRAPLRRRRHHAGHLGPRRRRGPRGGRAGASPSLVVPITVVILVGLFAVQRYGTGRIGAVFGRVMLLWFVVDRGDGPRRGAAPAERARGRARRSTPSRFFREHGIGGFLLLGSVVLVVTGGEALYADMGHFGVRPIRLAWFAVVMPALLLNYFGQGALLIERGGAVGEPVLRAGSRLVALPDAGARDAGHHHRLAGAHLRRLLAHAQAVQLGYFPRVRIVHTSGETEGQIYIPEINWILMVACLGARASRSAARATWRPPTASPSPARWRSPRSCSTAWRAALAAGAGCARRRSSRPFLAVDLAFLGANLTKIAAGRLVPARGRRRGSSP